MNNELKIELKDGLYYKGKSYFISFKYNAEIVNALRGLPKRKYILDKRVWEVPYNEQNEDIIKYLYQTYGDKSDFEANNFINTIKQQDINFDSIELPQEMIFNKPLYKHQIEAIKYGIVKNNFLLADEMGLGKTASLIHYAIYRKIKDRYKKCLIIAGINGLKYNWQNEIAIHSNEKGFILGSKTNKKNNVVLGGSKDIINNLNNINSIDEYFLITNIESLRNKEITDLLRDLINKNEIEMVIIDEAQTIKNSESQQGKAFLRLNPKTKVAATGTPIMNNPIELYTIFYWLRIDIHNFYAFKNYYCVMGGYKNYEIVGYKHLDELSEKLNNNMIRRLRKDVLDLPEKIKTELLLEMSKEQTKIYEDTKNLILKDLDKIISLPNPLTVLLRLRQATATTNLLATESNVSIKFDTLKDLAAELYNNKQKFIVYSLWENVIEQAYQILKPYNCSIISGKVKDYQREIEIAQFKDNDNFCIAGTIGALGVGYTLTEASTIIFLDSPWNRATKEQAEDRAYRIGQKNNLNIITLICKNTIDEKIEQLIYKKGLLSDAIVDNKIDINNNKELVNFLLS